MKMIRADEVLKILLVDDDEKDYFITKDLLSDVTGIKCMLDWVRTYEAALIEIKQNGYDVYFFDYHLGKHNGLKLLEEAVKAGCTAPIILLTGEDDREIDIKAMKAGAADYLVKGQIYPPLLERSIRYAIERKQAELTLRENVDRFRDLFDSSPDAIFVEDLDGNVLDANAAACNLHGMVHQELIGTNVLELVPFQKRADVIKTGNKISKQELDAFESFSVNKEGRAIPVEIKAKHIQFANKPAILLHVRDISERKALENQLLQAQKLESIGQLAAGVAHEINTPTQFVGDNIHFLKDAFDDLKNLLDDYGRLLNSGKTGNISKSLISKIETTIEDIELNYLCEEIPLAINQSLDGITRVSSIVHAMKDFSHPGDGDIMLIDLNKVIETTIVISRNEWKYLAEIITDFDPSLTDVPCYVGEFNQAILNIIINAAHAISDVVGDGSSEKGVIKISTHRQDCWAEIKISDTGKGIPESIRKKIFEPFFTTKEVGKGTGQGLTITHSVIVQKHNGFLDFETEEGKGTTFRILLPLCEELLQEEVLL